MNTSIDHTIRTNLRIERIKRGLSPAQLAKRVRVLGIDMDVKAPWQIEHEGRQIGTDELVAFCEVFGVPITDITEEREFEPQLPERHVHMLARGLFEVQRDDDEEFAEGAEEWVDLARLLSSTVREIVVELSPIPEFNRDYLLALLEAEEEEEESEEAAPALPKKRQRRLPAAS